MADSEIPEPGPTPDVPWTPPIAIETPGSESARFAGFLMLVAFGFAVFGMYRLYTYTSDEGPVGGDAYNYIILTNRGIGLLVAGAIAALFACAFLLLALRAQLAAKQ